MAQSLTIIEPPTNNEAIDRNICTQKRRLRALSNAWIGKTFFRKRVRANTVYALLITSHFLTLLSAIVTCIEVKDLVAYKDVALGDPSLSPHHSRGFNPMKFASFVLVALTCSLALITIVTKDKRNAQLLSRLRSTNRQLEKAVRKRTGELAEAIRAKDHFLGIATHDLKAPLNGIMGLVELIRIKNDSRSEAEDEYLAHIEYSCRRMHGLVHDILEINRIEQGKVIVKSQQVDLAQLLNKLWLDFAPQAGKKTIELAIEKIEAIIQTDADRLTRILENLLSNAIKFSPSKSNVSLNVRLGTNQLKCEVCDEGPGIPPDEQPRLFSKFQRLSNRPTGAEISTGLGLSIVKELTSELGGEIDFKTAPGKGTVFILTLPIGS